MSVELTMALLGVNVRIITYPKHKPDIIITLGDCELKRDCADIEANIAKELLPKFDDLVKQATAKVQPVIEETTQAT